MEVNQFDQIPSIVDLEEENIFVSQVLEIVHHIQPRRCRHQNLFREKKGKKYASHGKFKCLTALSRKRKAPWGDRPRIIRRIGGSAAARSEHRISGSVNSLNSIPSNEGSQYHLEGTLKRNFLIENQTQILSEIDFAAEGSQDSALDFSEEEGFPTETTLHQTLADTELDRDTLQITDLDSLPSLQTENQFKVEDFCILEEGRSFFAADADHSIYSLYNHEPNLSYELSTEHQDI